MSPRDSAGEGRLKRQGWRLLAASDRLVGVRVARWAASLVLRVRSRSATGRRWRRRRATTWSAAGWLEGVNRVATRPVPGAPELTRLPARWWTTSPRVRVRRLGLRLDLDLRDNLQRTLYATGTYEPAVVRFLHDELRPGDLVLDVGAHVGVHALTAATRLRRLAHRQPARHRWPNRGRGPDRRRQGPARRARPSPGGGTVIAFEPASDSAARLRAAAARNRLDVTVVEVALGAEPGTAELLADPAYDPADAGVRSLHGTGSRVQLVQVVTFDTWAAEHRLERLDLVKLDVEGAELAALQGMAGSLASLRPRALVVEVKQRVLDRAGVDGDEVRKLLGRLGYESTGQVLPVANEVYRPLATSRPPAASPRRSPAGAVPADVPGPPGVAHHQDVGELRAPGRELGDGHRDPARSGASGLAGRRTG